MSNEATGVFRVIKDVQTFTSGFEKREIVITIKDGQYEQHVKFELLKNDVVKSDAFKVGDSVKVSYNLKGNYYEPKDAYYTSLQAWRLEAVEDSTVNDTAQDEEPF